MELDPIVIKKETIEKLKAQVEKHVNNYIDLLPQKIEQMLDGMAKHYLGIISDGFGRYRFRENSIVHKLIDHKAESMIEDLVGSLTWNPTDQELSKIKAQALVDYKKTLQRYIRGHMNKFAEQRASEFDEEIRNLVKIEYELNSAKLPTKEQMADPEYGNSEFQKKLLEIQLDNIQARHAKAALNESKK